MNNLPRQKLCDILNMYGNEVCSDHKRIKGLLNDYCTGNYPEINFLLMALEEQVLTKLVEESKTQSYDMLSAILVKRLYTNRGMAAEIAHWAVDSWALALGVISSETSYITPQVSFNTPLSDRAYMAKSNPTTTAQQTIIVSPIGGHYTSISVALRSALPNTTILIKPGYYYEGFIIDKRVEIKGDGPREQIIIESRDTPCIIMQTYEEALVQGLTLRCKSTYAGFKQHAVEILKGRLKLIACDITSDTLACVLIRGRSAHPEIRDCRLHDAKASGLLIEREAQGIIENCDIFGNGYPNISIRDQATPMIKSCKIYGGRSHGILVWDKGSGTIEDCDIFENALDAIKTKNGGAPIVRGCAIYNNSNQEEWVYHNGMGNTRYPRVTERPNIHLRRNIPEYRSEASFTSIKYSNENGERNSEFALQQTTAQQPEKKQNFFDFILNSIGLNRKR